MALFKHYESADIVAINMIQSGIHIVFVGVDLPTGMYTVFTNRDALATPIKRYRRIYSCDYNMHPQPCVEIKAVNDWRRN